MSLRERGTVSGELTTFLAPRSVDAADLSLCQFARCLLANTDAGVVADVTGVHIEDYKRLCCVDGLGGGRSVPG